MVVIVIHGTFADNESDVGEQWWQRGSAFERWLSNALGEAFATPCEIEAFHWSGLNTETARRMAAKALSRRLEALEQLSRPYMIVGHSHGGSVAWRALVEASRYAPGLPSLRRCVTVGTPYFSFQPDWSLALLVAPALLGGLGLSAIVIVLGRRWWANVIDLVQFPEPSLLILMPALVATLAGIAVAGSATLLRGTIHAWRERRWRDREAAASSALRTRCLAIFSTTDEAINGLKATIGRRGAVAPRLGTRWAIVYNRFAAVAGDQFIWEQLSRRSQGNDLPGLRLAGVSTMPPGGTWPQCVSATAQRELDEAAAERAPGVFAAARSWLARDDGDVPAASFAGEGNVLVGAGGALIHTNYFGSAELRSMVLAALADDRLVERDCPRDEGRHWRAHRPPWLLRLVQAVSIASIVGGLLTMAQPLAARFDSEALLTNRIATAPLFEALWQSNVTADDYFRHLARRLPRSDMDRLISDNARTPDPTAFLAVLGNALAVAGRHDESSVAVSAALARVQGSAELPAGVSGPTLPLSEGASTLVRTLARVGRTGEIADLVRTRLADVMRDETAASLIEANTALGLAGARDFGGFLEHLARVKLEYRRRDALIDALDCRLDERTFTAALAMLPEGMRDEGRAAGLSAFADHWPATRLLTYLEPIEDAASRAIAATAVASAMRREGRGEDALDLLRRELKAFPSRPRDPATGHAVHYTRFAEAFVVLDRPTEGEDLLYLADSIGREHLADRIMDDTSGPARARLWARLGRVDRAFRTAGRVLGNERALLWRDVGRLVADKAGPATATAALGTLPRGIDSFYGLLGVLESAAGRATTFRIHGEMDRLVQQARAFPSPIDRSEALFQCAALWARLGNERRAILLSDECAAGDRIRALVVVMTARQ
jgi:hypothetical protein